jgi:hypothetical protein
MLRKLKVYEIGDVYRGKTQPQIRLQGRWLRQAGFRPHDRIVVRKEGSRLVIEHSEQRAQVRSGLGLLLSGKPGEECEMPDDEHTGDLELCEHGYPEGHGCEECEYWQRVDYEYDRYRDK